MNEKSGASLKTRLVLVAVFLLGCVTGVGLSGVYRSKANASLRESRSHDREAMFERIRNGLNLNDEKSAQMQKVLEETAGDFRALRGELKAKVRGIASKSSKPDARSFDDRTATKV
jgi:hypothetical protein